MLSLSLTFEMFSTFLGFIHSPGQRGRDLSPYFRGAQSMAEKTSSVKVLCQNAA